MMYYKKGVVTSQPKIQGVSHPTEATILANGWKRYINEVPQVGAWERAVHSSVTIEGDTATQAYTVESYAPEIITMAQCKSHLGVLNLLQTVDAAIAQMSQNVQIFWEYATTVERSTPLIQWLAQQLQIDLNEFFRAASEIQL
jgi:hypothetical protein